MKKPSFVHFLWTKKSLPSTRDGLRNICNYYCIKALTTNLITEAAIKITKSPRTALIRIFFPDFTLSSSPPAVRIWNPPYRAKPTAMR